MPRALGGSHVGQASLPAAELDFDAPQRELTGADVAVLFYQRFVRGYPAPEQARRPVLHAAQASLTGETPMLLNVWRAAERCGENAVTCH